MAIPSRGIGWGTEENLLWQISKQIERLTQVTGNAVATTSSTSTTAAPTTTTTTTLPVYRVYTALLTQTGLTPPTVVVLENTLGFTPTWEYVDLGWYRTNNTSFTEKTAIFLGNPDTSTGTEVLTFASSRTPSSGGSVVIQSRNAGARTNGMFFNTPIEIRVYN
jgi:hypothetical protein